MPHKRNPKSKWHAKNTARLYVLNKAQFKREESELISQVSVDDVTAFCLSASLPTDNVPDVMRGEVLKDSRGRGSFQVMREINGTNHS